MDNKILPEVTNAVKLTKTTKGYTWEIKLREDLNNWKKTVDLLQEIDGHLRKAFLEVDNGTSE